MNILNQKFPFIFFVILQLRSHQTDFTLFFFFRFINFQTILDIINNNFLMFLAFTKAKFLYLIKIIIL